MNIIGIGPMEMGIIAVVALLIFGPGKLPEVMGQAGKMVRDFRRMSAELTGEFEKTIAEAKDVGNSITGEIGGMTKEVNSVTNSVKKDLGLKGATATSKSKAATGTKLPNAKTTSTAKTGAKSTSNPASSSTTSKRASTSSSSAASKTKTTSTAPKTKAAADKKLALPAASREDPDADMSLFEPKPIERARRSRKAIPSVIADLTPRYSELEPVVSGSRAAGDGHQQSTPASVSLSATDDALLRARKRRRSASYVRTSA
ncbi:MAG: twin-arginine translocase TatA/TatE family subunit [Chloroflexota bacterium]|nr:twin-arginine translocase TatA/TatE family subunit [Chloroflexota bacterium]